MTSSRKLSVVGYLHQTVRVLGVLGGFMCVVGIFILHDHKAVPHIGLAVMLPAALIDMFLSRDISAHVSWYVPIGALGVLITYYIGLVMHQEPSYDVTMWLQNHAVLLGYGLVFLFLPIKNAKFYTVFFYLFIITCFIICFVAFKSYLHEQRLGDASLMKGYAVIPHFILPFGIWHHVLGIFIITSLLFIYTLKEYKLFIFHVYEGYLLLVLGILMALFLHILGARLALFLFYSFIFYLLFDKATFIKNSYLRACFICFALIVFSTPIFFFSNTARLRMQQSIKQVIDYTADSNTNQTPEEPNRITSIKVAAPLIKDHFWKGLGAKNVDSVYSKIYLARGVIYPHRQLRPHIQFMYFAVVWGVPLAVLLALFYTLPFLSNGALRFRFFLFFFIIQALYGLSDMPLHLREYFYFFSFFTPFLLHFIEALKKEKIASRPIQG